MKSDSLEKLHSFGLKANRAKVLYISKLCFLFIDKKKPLGRALTRDEADEVKENLRAELRGMGWDKPLIHYYVKDAEKSAELIEYLTENYKSLSPKEVKTDATAAEYIAFLELFGITSIASLRRASDRFMHNGGRI